VIEVYFFFSFDNYLLYGDALPDILSLLEGEIFVALDLPETKGLRGEFLLPTFDDGEVLNELLRVGVCLPIATGFGAT
jgi:hypothetical protein